MSSEKLDLLLIKELVPNQVVVALVVTVVTEVATLVQSLTKMLLF